jgi:hypothetical protein
VRAYNERGWGAFSPDNESGARIETEPSQMGAPTRGPGTGIDRIELTWSLLTSPADGYSAITTYALSWDAGSGGTSWTSLVGEASDYTLGSYLVTAGVSEGQSYQFKLRAKNFWGWGPESPIATVLAATTPAQPAAPTTSIDPTTGALDIAWVAPSARGSPITSYTVEIQDAAASSWHAETANCGGSTAVACSVPMSVLIASPYSLTQGTIVRARVYASNAFGAGATSAANTDGAKVRVAPLVMAAPRRGAATSTGQIAVEWDLLSAPSNGDSPVTSYHLVWDAGSGTTSTDLVGLVSPYTLATYSVATGVTEGSTYRFKVRARNVYGWGPFSPEVSIAATDVPSQMQVVTTSIVGTSARITWTAPASNGATITAYEILIRHADGTTLSAAATCDGADPVIVGARQCEVPLATLRAAPYSLARGALVQAKARALNAQGYGPYS